MAEKGAWGGINLALAASKPVSTGLKSLYSPSPTPSLGVWPTSGPLRGVIALVRRKKLDFYAFLSFFEGFLQKSLETPLWDPQNGLLTQVATEPELQPIIGE